MPLPFRLSAVVVLGCALWGCSSSTPTDAGGGTGGSSTGGKAGSGGAKSTGGAATGTGGGFNVSACATDAGADNCRRCLAQYCCDDLGACLSRPLCRSALATHEACFRKVGAEPSACFGDFTRTVQGDADGLPPVSICIVTSCSQVCGGPNAL
jgi:hypothetical protein